MNKKNKKCSAMTKESWAVTYIAASVCEEGDINEAQDLFTKVIKKDRGFAPAYYMRGLTFSELGDTERAAKDFLAAYKHEPKLMSYDIIERMLNALSSGRGKSN